MSSRDSLPGGVWLMASALWGVFLMGMYWSGKLELFQARPYFYFTAAAGAALVLLALKTALWPSRVICSCGHDHGPGEPCEAHHHEEETEEHQENHEHCECGDLDDHDHENQEHNDHDDAHGRRGGMARLATGMALLAFLLAPALAGVLIPHRAMLSVAAAKRMGGELDSSGLLGALRREERQWNLGAKDYQPATPLDVLEIGEQSPGLKVSTVGFVLKRTAALPEDVARMARFRMTCCAADATPIAVLVRGAGAATMRTDAWVEVRGTVERQMIAGRQATVIVVDPATRPSDGIREVDPPERPYI